MVSRAVCKRAGHGAHAIRRRVFGLVFVQPFGGLVRKRCVCVERLQTNKRTTVLSGRWALGVCGQWRHANRHVTTITLVFLLRLLSFAACRSHVRLGFCFYLLCFRGGITSRPRAGPNLAPIQLTWLRLKRRGFALAPSFVPSRAPVL